MASASGPRIHEHNSTAGQSPLTASALLVCQAVALKDRLFVACQQLAVVLIDGASFAYFYRRKP
jgi:hypothetical protein